MKLPVLLSQAGTPPDARAGDEPVDGIDCVVVGHNDLPFHDMVERARATERASAHYDDVKLNSVLLGGRRLQYIDLFNVAAGAATGQQHDLNPFRQPHLAVCYLTSFLRRRGLRTEFVNFPSYDRDHFRDLLSQSPRAVAITTTFYVETDPMVELIGFIREHAPDTKIILGGPWVQRCCASYDELTQDYVLQGVGADFYINDSQGELTLAQLVVALRRGGGDELLKVPNLIWTDDGALFRRTPRVIENNDMDANAIDWTLFDPGFVQPTVYLRTARSCPFACAFCCYPVAAGEHVLNEVEVIIHQLRTVREMGAENVVFVDDTFNVPLPRFKHLLRRMIEERLGLKWMSFFRCSNADAEAFALMKESGCVLAFLGIESGDETVLKNMDKFAKVDRYREGIRHMRANDILSHASLIVGFPGETQRTIDNTMEFIETTRPTFFAPQIFYHDPRSPLQARAKEFGLSGSGFKWTHATADWRDAIAWTRGMYQKVRVAEAVGGYSLGCWGIFYLLSKGYSVGQVSGFLRVTREMVLEGLDEREGTHLDELVAILRPDADVRADRSLVA